MVAPSSFVHSCYATKTPQVEGSPFSVGPRTWTTVSGSLGESSRVWMERRVTEILLQHDTGPTWLQCAVLGMDGRGPRQGDCTYACDSGGPRVALRLLWLAGLQASLRLPCCICGTLPASRGPLRKVLCPRKVPPTSQAESSLSLHSV
jgi:hypothetical protein